MRAKVPPQRNALVVLCRAGKPTVLRLDSKHAEAIRQHAARDYPRECCGVLLGSAEGDRRRVRDVLLSPTSGSDPQRSGELLRSKTRSTSRAESLFHRSVDLLRVVKEARTRGLEVVGYYHSHPDQPLNPQARPRVGLGGLFLFDRAVEYGEPGEMACWKLAGDGRAFDRSPSNG